MTEYPTSIGSGVDGDIDSAAVDFADEEESDDVADVDNGNVCGEGGSSLSAVWLWLPEL